MPYLYHKFTSAKADSADSTLVRPSNWNARLDYSNAANTGPSGTDATVREVLTADRTYFISSGGSDSNTGLTSSTAFATVQKAANVSQTTLDLGGFDVIASLSSGSFSGAISVGTLVGGGSFKIIGAGSSLTTVISTNSDTLTAVSKAIVGLGNVKIQSDGGNCVSVQDNARFDVVSAVDFSSATGGHIELRYNAIFECDGVDYTVSGNATSHIRFTGRLCGGRAAFADCTITFNSTPTFSDAVAYAVNGGAVLGINGATFTGTATGVRFVVSNNSAITGTGGNPNFFPGDSAGTLSDGGLYL